jgi:hyperosmotically inducible protein
MRASSDGRFNTTVVARRPPAQRSGGTAAVGVVLQGEAERSRKVLGCYPNLQLFEEIPMKKLLVASMVAVSLAGCANMGGSGPQRSVGQAVDDVTIGTKLKAALAADPELSALKINVDTTQGNVKLRGEVKNIALRRKAEEMARKIEGVKSVDNQLLITG